MKTSDTQKFEKNIKTFERTDLLSMCCCCTWKWVVIDLLDYTNCPFQTMWWKTKKLFSRDDIVNITLSEMGNLHLILIRSIHGKSTSSHDKILFSFIFLTNCWFWFIFVHVIIIILQEVQERLDFFFWFTLIFCLS